MDQKMSPPNLAVPRIVRVLLFAVVFAGMVPVANADGPTEKGRLSVRVLPTFGSGGAVRPATIDVGDTFTATVLADGIEADEKSQVDISGEWRLIDEEGRTVLGPWSDRNVPHLSFGGSTSPFYVSGEIPESFVPGNYVVRVSVTDHVANRRATGDLTLTVAERQLGTKALRLSNDYGGNVISAGSFVVGQTMYVHYSLTNFATVEDKVQVKNTLTVIDVDSRKVVGAPIVLDANGPVHRFSRSDVIPGMFHLNVNAPGRFLLRITLDDEIAKRRRVMDIPVVCHSVDVSSPDNGRLR